MQFSHTSNTDHLAAMHVDILYCVKLAVSESECGLGITLSHSEHVQGNLHLCTPLLCLRSGDFRKGSKCSPCDLSVGAHLQRMTWADIFSRLRSQYGEAVSVRPAPDHGRDRGGVL